MTALDGRDGKPSLLFETVDGSGPRWAQSVARFWSGGIDAKDDANLGKANTGRERMVGTHHTEPGAKKPRIRFEEP
jgi:membrane-bound inhibitor of C-type lysozyme